MSVSCKFREPIQALNFTPGEGGAEPLKSRPRNDSLAAFPVSAGKNLLQCCGDPGTRIVLPIIRPQSSEQRGTASQARFVGLVGHPRRRVASEPAILSSLRRQSVAVPTEALFGESLHDLMNEDSRTPARDSHGLDGSTHLDGKVASLVETVGRVLQGSSRTPVQTRDVITEEYAYYPTFRGCLLTLPFQTG